MIFNFRHWKRWQFCIAEFIFFCGIQDTSEQAQTVVDGLWAQILFSDMSVRGERGEAPTYGVRFLLPFSSQHKELKNYKVAKRLSVLPFLTSCGI